MTDISKEIHNLIQGLSIPERTELVKEAGILASQYNLSPEMAEEQVYKKYYGEQYKDILKKEIIKDALGTNDLGKAIEDKLNLILNRIDQSEGNLSVLLQNKQAYYIKQGYDDEKALEIAKAELAFDSPDTSKLEYNIKSKETTSDSIEDSVELLSRL